MARAKTRGRQAGNPWTWAFEASPAGGTRRLLFFVGLLTIIGFWEISSLRGPDFWGQVFSARVWGHLLALGLAFWIGLRAAALTLQSIFGLSSLGEAQGQLLRTAFYGRSHSLVVRDGGLASPNQDHALARVGGPGQVRVHLENAAVFETRDGELRVLGPTSRRAVIEGFERLRTVVDLRDQVLNLNVQARSQDGLRVSVEGARAVFSVRRGPREASLRLPHPFEEEAILRLVLEERVEARALAGPAFERGQSLLAAQGQAFFERQVQEFIAQFSLGELLAPELDEAGESQVGSANAFLAREKIREQFKAWVEDAAAEIGLELQWMDIGAWVLDERAQAILEERLGAPNSREASEASPYQDAHRQEMLRLYSLLPIKEWEELLAEKREILLGELVQGFQNLFQQLQQRLVDLRDGDKQEWERVLRFLSTLIARRQGAK